MIAVQATSQPSAADARAGERGFTLVEALFAIVILIFGLMAVTNLLLVAATNNSVANQGSAATAIASERLEQLKQLPFTALGADGTFPDPAPRLIDGVGQIQTTVTISSLVGDCQLRFITVTSEGTGALARARSRASFSTFRTCTGRGCPPPAGPC